MNLMERMALNDIRPECIKCSYWNKTGGCTITSGFLCPIKDEIQMSYYDWIHIKHHLSFYDAKKGPLKRFSDKIDKLKGVKPT